MPVTIPMLTCPNCHCRTPEKRKRCVHCYYDLTLLYLKRAEGITPGNEVIRKSTPPAA